MPALWFLGHLMCSKDYVSGLYQEGGIALSLEFYEKWAGDCDQVDWENAPSLAEMLGLYKQIHGRLRELVGTLSPEDLHRETPVEIQAPLDDPRCRWCRCTTPTTAVNWEVCGEPWG
jgi:hypothetical protein